MVLTPCISFRNQNCFQIKHLLAIQYFSKQTLVSLDNKLGKDLRKCDQEKKVKFTLSETDIVHIKENLSTEQHDKDDQEDSNDQHIIIKERRRIKNISPLLNLRDE